MSNTRIEGIPRPNSLVEYDNEYGFQFRIQCEVPLYDEQQAMELLRHLKANNKAGFRTAKKIVTDVIEEYNKTATKPISDKSKDLIGMALDDNISQAN